jgi:hypothetical protein
VIKLQSLRIPYGHFSSRAKRLMAKYGKEVANRASQIVLSQLVNSAILAEEGVILPVPEMWEFERNLGWEEYCELLWNEGGGSGGMPMPTKIEVYADGDAKIGGKASPELSKALKKLLGEDGFTQLGDLSEAAGADGHELDASSRDFISAVDSALRSQNSDLKSQGFIKGDAEQFIEALNRPSRVPFQQFIRGMHGKYQGRRRKISRNRPSRRGDPIVLPDGRRVDFYKGRVRDKQVMALFIIDTSGSMKPRELRCVDAELRGLNTGYQKCESWFGRGGTSFQPGFDYAHRMQPRPDYLVYFTDGYDYSPLAYESEIPTLWILTSTGMSIEDFRKSICSWGEICKIDVEGEEVTSE